MTFTEGQLVTVTWVDHTSKSGKPIVKTHTKKAKFVQYNGAKTAVVEVETPIGKVRQTVLISKLGAA